ncbi:hypothetical protein BA022_16540 [Diaphorobacter nitroreducens]|uniref:hypothetical protein n=1 Tax=Diaphorobacter nitroreducens TaxID=164759 RepID=UPI000B59F61E|nr:hypothetical protein [Diaphorobacter nitroreducens]ASI70009.1 hypothetical protein BA022_16540 [Diaphorobacter nitroreducens]
MTCYALINGQLQIAEDDGSYEDNIAAAGYYSQISTPIPEAAGAEITVYEYMKNDREKPLYYIDVSGQNSQLAALIANDFPSLVSTLREIAPLISLVGLDQQMRIQIANGS